MDPLREQLDRAGCSIAADGTVVLYHATNPSGAVGILRERVLRTSDGLHVFVSTSPAIVSVLSDAEVIVPVRVLIDDLGESNDDLEHDDPTLQRVDYTLLADEVGMYRPKSVGRYAFDHST
jgi:hypothetical protein